MDRVVPRAAVSARWRRRTAVPDEPFCSVGVSPVDSRAVHVWDSTTPFAVRPLDCWNAVVAWVVAVSKVPLGVVSAGRRPAAASRHWTALTALPVEPLWTV